jgi:transposase
LILKKLKFGYPELGLELEQLIKYVWETYGVEYNSKKSYYDLLHEGGKSWKKRSNGTPNILKKRLMNVWQILKKTS